MEYLGVVSVSFKIVDDSRILRDLISVVFNFGVDQYIER